MPKVEPDRLLPVWVDVPEKEHFPQRQCSASQGWCSSELIATLEGKCNKGPSWRIDLKGFPRPFGPFDTQQDSMDSSSADFTADIGLLWYDPCLPSQQACSERVSHDRNSAEKASN